MRIEYVGSGRGVTVRVVSRWEWNPGNGYVCEVDDEEMARRLLELPGGEFVEAKDEKRVELRVDDGLTARAKGPRRIFGEIRGG
jgi:spermidine synthase